MIESETEPIRKKSSAKRAAKPKAAATGPSKASKRPQAKKAATRGKVAPPASDSGKELTASSIKAALSPQAKPPRPRRATAPRVKGTAQVAPQPVVAPKAESRPAKVIEVSAEERHRMITERAYSKALLRGLQGGDPQHDWLTAEAEVDALIAKMVRSK